MRMFWLGLLMRFVCHIHMQCATHLRYCPSTPWHLDSLSLYRYTVLCFALYGSSSLSYGIIHNIDLKQKKRQMTDLDTQSPHWIKNRKVEMFQLPRILGKPIWGNPRWRTSPVFLFCELVTRSIRDLPLRWLLKLFCFSFGFFDRYPSVIHFRAWVGSLWTLQLHFALIE